MGMADDYFLLVCDDVPHDVVLTGPGIRVLDVAQVVRRLTGLSLWRSKVLATQVPALILDGVHRADAEAAATNLRAAGALAQVRSQPEPDFLKPCSPQNGPAHRKAPHRAENPQVGGSFSSATSSCPGSCGRSRRPGYLQVGVLIDSG